VKVGIGTAKATIRKTIAVVTIGGTAQQLQEQQ
jgi:hypothetical protein